MMNLTTLAPDIVDAILQNALPDHLTLFDLAVDPLALWEEQRWRVGDSTDIAVRAGKADSSTIRCAAGADFAVRPRPWS